MITGARKPRKARRRQPTITDKTVVCIVGLGYVGLPLALAFAEAGLKVLAVDIQQRRVNRVNKGRSYIVDVDSRALKKVIGNGLLEATTDQSRLRLVDAICICVPTPLTKTKDPDLSYVISESEVVSRVRDPSSVR